MAIHTNESGQIKTTAGNMQIWTKVFGPVTANNWPYTMVFTDVDCTTHLSEIGEIESLALNEKVYIDIPFVPTVLIVFPEYAHISTQNIPFIFKGEMTLYLKHVVGFTSFNYNGSDKLKMSLSNNVFEFENCGTRDYPSFGAILVALA